MTNNDRCLYTMVNNKHICFTSKCSDVKTKKWLPIERFMSTDLLTYALRE